MKVTHAFGGAVITVPAEDLPSLIQMLLAATLVRQNSAEIRSNLTPEAREKHKQVAAKAQKLMRDLQGSRALVEKVTQQTKELRETISPPHDPSP